MILTGKHRYPGKKTVSFAPLSTTVLAQTDPGSNTALGGEGPAAKHVSRCDYSERHESALRSACLP